MRLPVEWLKEYVDITMSDEELAELLTMSGSEVESRQNGVFEVKVTPNRGDTLSILGMAQEVAALTRQSVRGPEPCIHEDSEKHESFVKINIEAPDLCARYAARMVTDICIGPSPEWMQKRLIAAGMRPINNVVDITNYVMLEFGQPLHAFDYDLLSERTIIVRRARQGESIVTLDGVFRQLSPEILVIADAHRPVAVAGIMGGAETEVSERTRQILLESAHFDPLCIRRGSKLLGLTTEASYRFERWVDPSGVVSALDRAVQLMRDLGVGRIVPGVEDCYPRRYTPVTIQLRPRRCNEVLGTNFEPSLMRDALASLGLEVRGEDPFEVTVPTRRADLKAEIDLIEEVARIAGYDRIPYELPKDALIGKHSDWQLTSDLIRETLARAGLYEAVGHSLTDPALVSHFYTGQTVRLRNPVSEEFSILRPSLIPTLAAAAQLSARRGTKDVALFEVGKIFLPGSEGVQEKHSVAALITGTLMGGRWNLKPAPLTADFFLCKGIVEELLDAFNIQNASFEPSSRLGMHPGRTARVCICGEEVGFLGQIHPEVEELLELPGPTYVFELDPDSLSRHSRGRTYTPLPKFPAITRDIAVVMDENTPSASVRSVILQAGGELVESVELFDLYRGPNLPPGKKSIAFSVVLRSPDTTLTDEQADAVIENIRTALSREVGASFR
jgi:phenylalanyl-tRNA synthetase beta chain